MRRLKDVKQHADVITGPGILVKLFAVPPDDTQSVDDSKPTLWIVGSPNAANWTPRNSRDAHRANAKASDKAKASHAAKAWSTSKPRVKAKVSGGKAGRQKEQRSPAKGGRNVAEQPVQEDHSELNDTSDEQEGAEDEEEEDDAGEDDAGQDEDLEEEEAGEREDEEHEGEEDLAENIGKEGEQEAVREGEREGEEKTGDETEPHSETRGKDCAVHDGEEEEHGGDEEAGEEQGDQDQVQGVENAMGQRATANNRDGTWRSWETGDTNGEEDEERCTNAGEEEKTAEDENGGAEERRKRAFEGDEAMDNSPLEEHPNKRSKNERGENENGAAMEDSFERGLETPPRPRTPSPMSSTPSPGSTVKIVRQTSVVPGLEDTESAVWDAAQRDAIFTSLKL